MAEQTRIFAHSSNVASAAWDDETRVLTVNFKNGQSYAYDGVDEVAWLAFADAPSPGKHLWSNIKDAYTSRRL